jgi:hypothetical protein
MRPLLLCLAFLLAQASWAQTYSTTFPATEDPISQSGEWVNGGSTGVEWGNVQTKPGLAFGTIINGAPPYNDSTAVLAGSWGSNQTVQGTAVITPNSQDFSSQEEVELHLNMTITPDNITGYELDFSTISGNPYIVIVRWNGPLNSYCYINSGSTCSNPVTVPMVIHNGDVLKGTNVNGLITVYVNGVAEATATDTTYSNGSPGVGFWNVGGNTGDLANYGFSEFTATDGSSSGAPPAPTHLSVKVQ